MPRPGNEESYQGGRDISKYLEFGVIFKNKALLRAALESMGYHKVEEGQAIPLVGYDGRIRKTAAGATVTADIVVRRAHVGGSSNDLGFRWAKELDGYVPIVSEYDVGYLADKHGGTFVPALLTRYNELGFAELTRRLHGIDLGTTRQGNVSRQQIRVMG